MKKLLLLLFLIPNLVMADDFDMKNGFRCFNINPNIQATAINCENSLGTSTSSDTSYENFDTYTVPEYGLDGVNAWIAVDREGKMLPRKNAKGEWNWGAGASVGSADVMRSDHFLGLLPDGYTFVVAERRDPVTGNVASGASSGKYKYDFSSKTWSTGMSGSQAKIINGNYSD